MADDIDPRDILAITDKEIWEEARDRLAIAVEAEGKVRKEAKEDLKFREGDQWDSVVVTTESQQTPELTINLTDSLVRRVVNNMKQQRPRGKCHPVGDNANVDVAEVINGLGRHIEYRSEASIAYDTAGEMAVTCGWGFWRLVSEYATPESFDQEIRILPIRNIFTVYLDPSAIMPTGSDSDWALITVKMKRTEYKRLHPKEEMSAFINTGTDELTRDWEDDQEIRLAEYFRIREISEKLFELSDGKGGKFSRFKSEMPAPESLDASGLTITDERESSHRQVEWFKLNGKKVIDRKILPGTWIPIVRCEGNAIDIDGAVIRRGMVRAMQDPQRMVNYGEVAKIRRLGITPQAPWIAAEGQLDGHPEWAEANRMPTTVLVYKPTTVMTAQGEQVLPPPQRQPPAAIEQGFSEFVQAMRSNLLAVAGMSHDPGQDEQGGQVVSGAAIQRRQGMSDQSHFQYYDNLTFAIAHTWRIMLQWIPYYYSEERMQRIIGEDGVPSLIKINQPVQENGINKVKNDLTVGRYDVVMETGPGYETRREEGADALMQLLGTPLGQRVAQIGPDLVIRTLDHPYMQELADRFAALIPDGLKKAMEGMPAQAKSIIQTLTTEVTQLRQQLQQVSSGVTKAHLEATVKAHDVETWAEIEREKMHLEALTKHNVEEIKGGVQLLDSHIENQRKNREGERLITEGSKESPTPANPTPAAPAAQPTGTTGVAQ